MSSTPLLDDPRECPTCDRLYPAHAAFCAVDGVPLVPSSPDLRLRAMEPGRYQIVRRIGRGGMGDVYLAMDTRLRRYVAVKYVRGAYSTDGDATARMEREARNAARLSHEHLVHVFDLVRESGALVLVMEYAAGPTLQEAIRDAAPFAVGAVARVIDQLASGLSAVHGVGLVHRDLKPSNVVLTYDAERGMMAKILDFGITRSFDDPTQSITATGVTMGTATFMSPEQLDGAALDARADVFALGAVAAYMLSGTLRVPRPGVPLSLAFVRGADRWPESLVQVLRRALAMERDDRTATPRQFADELAAVSRTMPDLVLTADETRQTASTALSDSALSDSALSDSALSDTARARAEMAARRAEIPVTDTLPAAQHRDAVPNDLDGRT